MKRRQFRIGVTMSVPIGIAGCLGRAELPIAPDDMNVETHQGGISIKDADIGVSSNTPRSVQAVFTDRDTARQRLRDGEDLTEFLESTDFDQSYIVVVVAGTWSGDRWLKLVEVDRIPSGLRSYLYRHDPEGSMTADLSVHSLAVRITDERTTSVPNTIKIQVDKTHTGTIHGELSSRT